MDAPWTPRSANLFGMASIASARANNSEPIVINLTSLVNFNASSSFNQTSKKYQVITTASFQENIECKQEVRRNINVPIFNFENYAIGSLLFHKKTPYDISIGCLAYSSGVFQCIHFV